MSKKKKKIIDKPKMPDTPIFIDMGAFKAKLQNDFKRYSSGLMSFKFEDCVARLIANKGTPKEREIGEVGGSVGGAVFLCINGREYSIPVMELWNIAKAVDKKYLQLRRANP